MEADEQQVNLTRFSLFFPEKREFFLENQGTFTFGGAGGVPGGATATAATRRCCSTAGASVSRAAREVPILARRAPDGTRRPLRRRLDGHPDAG